MRKNYLRIIAFTLLMFFGFVYMKASTPDTCWSFNIDDIDQAWSGYYTPNISDIKIYKGGVLAVGFASHVLFPSRDKKVLPRNNWVGEYLCRYDMNGNYLWHLNSNMSDFNSHNERPYIVSVTSDRNDMIYIGGNTGKTAKIYTPDSSTTEITYCPDNFQHYYYGYIAKIDSNGTIVWNGVFPGGVVKKVLTDTYGNMYVLGKTRTYLHYYDGDITTTLYKSINEKSDFIVALDSTGKLRWHTYFAQNYTNVGGANDFGIDGQGNIYIGGIYENEVRFYSFDGTFFDSLRSNGVYGGRLFLTKLDNKGIVQWVLACTEGNTRIDALQVDTEGNCYFSGNARDWSQKIVILNADKTIYEVQTDGYLVMKVSNKGIVQWESGNKDAQYGHAHDITLSENQVSVIGSIIKESSSEDDWNGRLFFSNGRDTTFRLTKSEYFIANYDTSGSLRYIALSGTLNGTLMKHQEASIERKDNGHFISVNGSKFITPKHIDFFGNRVLLTGTDGIIAHIGNSPCNYNNITSVEDDSLHSEVLSKETFFGLHSEIFDNAESVYIMSSLGEEIHTINSDYTGMISKAIDDLYNGLYFISVKYKNGSRVIRKIQIAR